MQQILHVVVVGFHHKKGCQVEFSYPKLDGNGEGGLSDEWINLPSLALPDGAHNVNDDVIFFILPSNDRKGESVFGISCYRQIPSEELLSKGDDITRSTVQKSVCVLSRIPLYGALRTKLQVITRAYFAERDFTKVEVLSQMYRNLCDMFNDGAVDDHAASIDISVQDLFIRFRHRTLVLFKLLLLEKKVIFNVYPAQLLGTTMVALVSLFPKLLEEGLRYCSVPSCSDSKQTTESTMKHTEDAKDPAEITIPSSSTILDEEPIMEKDGYGFPLSIFTNGNLFHPYVSLSYLDMIRSKSVRGFMVGATNALFVTKRDLIDAIVTVDDQDCGQIEFLNGNLKRELALTSADLRFGDYLLKNIEENRRSTAMFEGNDEWLRMQMREYLLSMGASSRSDLTLAVADFGVPFINSWRFTRNYQVWMAGPHDDLSGIVPGHAFSGETGNKVRQGVSNWFRGGVSNAEEVTEEFTGTSRVVDDDISSEQSNSRTSLSWLSPPDREQITNKVKGLSTWLRGGVRDEGIEATVQDQSSPKDSTT
ncbi:hypothetical protein KIN20_012165 [Parelaphostrongylus tenuis]|uniref:UDENN domain-containing protein n=1 Tax=Parelaphostrongylus tenuis TaxID=148309 RepID=A0AAD5ME11_PARTN|nr:hypothetical protein KIN20_012165 [Parelaphostrongylus tenuis]